MVEENTRDPDRRPATPLGLILPALISHSGLVTAAICIGFLIAGFWPFDFMPENRARWPADENGVEFTRLSVLDSEKAVDLGSTGADPLQPASVTLELLLQTETFATRSTYTILSLYDGELPENLLLAQWRSALLMRNAVVDSAGVRRYRETGVINALRKGEQSFLAIASGPDSTSYYIDGALAKTYPRLSLRSDSLRGRLLVGTAPTGGASWMGRLSGLAAFNHTLPAADILRHYRMWTGRRAREIASEPGVTALYLFDEDGGRTVRDHSAAHNDLVLPQHYLPLHRNVLLAPNQDLRLDFSNADDVAVNILGFLPFGFFFFLRLRRSRPKAVFVNVCLAVIAGTAVSTAIEATQAFLPTRSSSVTDIVSNALGAAIGIVAAGFLTRASDR
jgi:hypothetical protein